MTIGACGEPDALEGARPVRGAGRGNGPAERLAPRPGSTPPTGRSGSRGAWVRDVEFGERAVIVTVKLRRKRPVCSGCGARGLQIKDHRVKSWRHLDLGGLRCQVECRLRRLYCPCCGDLPEMVEWARGGTRYTRDFDEVSYRADHRFLTCVANHETDAIVWATEGRNAVSLQAFFAGLTDQQKASIRAVSIDMPAGYEKAITQAIPDAQVCFDPFHVVQLAGKAADQVRRDEYNAHGRSSTGEGNGSKARATAS